MKIILRCLYAAAPALLAWPAAALLLELFFRGNCPLYVILEGPLIALAAIACLSLKQALSFTGFCVIPFFLSCFFWYRFPSKKTAALVFAGWILVYLCLTVMVFGNVRLFR